MATRSLQRRLVRRIQRALSPRLPPRHPDDYATHIPILVGVASVLDVTRVLELGSGRYSTLTFLDRKAFPCLTRIDSYEDDATWAAEVTTLAQGDKRLRLFVVDGRIAQAASQAAEEAYDLIFIDDSAAMEERIVTISTMAAKPGLRGLVLIHDFEIQEYRQAASPFAHRFVFDAFHPQVGAVWNTGDIRRGALRQLNRRIRASAATINPTDVSAWVEGLRR